MGDEDVEWTLEVLGEMEEIPDKELIKELQETVNE